MRRQTRRSLAGAVIVLALSVSGPGHAAEPVPGGKAEATHAKKKKKGPGRGEKAVARALRTAVRRKRISRRNYKHYASSTPAREKHASG